MECIQNSRSFRTGDDEFYFDMLGALVADAKMAGEFDGPKPQDKDQEVSMTFEVYHRNHPNPPREWLERKLVMPEIIAHEMYPPQPGG